MATQTIPAILRIRRGSYTSWTTANPILREGEAGVIISGDDTGKFKVGDGTTAWNDLPYIIGADGKTATIQAGNVTTVPYNVPAQVINSGTDTDAVFDFTIPQGVPGVTVPDISGLDPKGEPEDADFMIIYDPAAQQNRQITVEGLMAAVNSRIDALQASLLDKSYPIGSIYISVNSTEPATLFGGTWARFGRGRVLVSANENDTDTVNSFKPGVASGTKTHTLTVGQMPSHTHTGGFVFYVHNEIVNRGTTFAIANQNVGYTGGSEAHPNVQPYITVYMWERTA